MKKIRLSKKSISFIILAIIILPTIIIGEVVINVSRHREYEDLPGFTEEILELGEGLHLQTWFTNTSSKVAILVHGHFDNAGLMYERYNLIYKNLGYDLVIMDLRNHGRSSDDKPVEGGVKAADDVVAVLEWISDKSWEESLLVSSSMGAVASIIALSQIDANLMPDVVILDSIYLDFTVTLNLNLKKHNVLQPWRFLVLNYILNIRFSQKEFPDILALLHIIDILPILVLHGTDDIESPVSVIDQLIVAEFGHIETSRIEGGEHSRLFKEQEYIDKVVAFLDSND